MSQVDLRQLAVDRSTPPEGLKPKRQNYLMKYGVPVVILGAFCSVVGWSLRESLLPATAVTVTPVVLARAEVQQAGTPLFQAAGWIEPRPTATVVSAQVEGVVETLLVVEGQEVKKGQPLARLVDAEVRLALSEARANLRLRDAEIGLTKATLESARQGFEHPTHLEAALAEAESIQAKVTTEIKNLPFLLTAAEARLQLAQQDYDGKKAVAESIAFRSVQRAQSEYEGARAVCRELEQREKSLQAESKLLERRVAALRKQLELKTEERRKVQEAESSLSIAEARVEQAKLAVESAELKLTRMTIVAPIAGKVLALHAQPGRRLMGLSPASERDASAVVSLYDPSHLQVRADVRLEDVRQATIGQPVQISTAALETPLTGEVIGITSQADIQKNTLQVKVAIHSPSPVIKPEMLAQVTFLAPETPGAKSSEGEDPLRQLVPRDLVQSTEAGTAVWVADLTSSQARRRNVQIGKAGTDRLVEVTQGLTATDKLIVSGREALSEGERVRVVGQDKNLGGSSSSAANPMVARDLNTQQK